ncbi:GH17952 [Drosophila grimshawi]|uniref:GH17952 n=1 Tax=Drosophila grimshawi TaxID=7222 RepID=B4JXG7_DROGR|nr:GH17952 [Drosophila grimshawi]
MPIGCSAVVGCFKLTPVQLDDELKQQELDERKELRKRTEFKARPNPFKPA